MQISLHIERDDDACSDACGFLRAAYPNKTGGCTLFKETLQPILYYGDVEGWMPCKDCNRIYDKVKEKQLGEEND